MTFKNMLCQADIQKTNKANIMQSFDLFVGYGYKIYLQKNYMKKDNVRD